MPYIGNDLATQFQAFATQTITGDGSTGYTLDRAVANGKEILVYINNVKQEEGSGKAYTATGTTITFSEAVASGDSCYLVYMGSAQQTVTPPAGSIVGSQLSSSFSIFDDEDSNIVIGRGRIGNTIQASDHASFQHRDLGTGSNNDYAILQTASGGTQINSSSGQSLFINIGNSQAIKVDSNKIITMENQPAFLVGKSGAQDNLATDTTVTITFDSEIFDQNSDFASNTFTAPVTGRYYLQFRLNLGSTDQDTSNFQAQIAASNRTLSFNFDHGALDQDAENHTMNGSTLMDMDANDTCTIRIYQSGGAAQVDVSSSSTFSGFLAC